MKTSKPSYDIKKYIQKTEKFDEPMKVEVNRNAL
jgi:hypothetical protein